MPGSCCSCEYPDSPWSNFTSQGSPCTFDSRGEPANFDGDELVFRMIDRDYFLGFAYENPDLETDVMMQCPGRGSQPTPKNNDDAEIWESPGLMLPPDSSSPIGLGDDSSPSSMHPAPPMSHREDVTTGRLLFCRPRDSGQSRVKALFNDWADSNAFIFPTTTSINRSPPHSPTSKLQTQEVLSTWTNMDASLHGQGHLTNSFESSSSMPACSAAQGPLDERLRAISERQVMANVHDICAVTTRTTIEQTNNLDKADETNGVSARGAIRPLSRKRAIFSDPTILDLAISNDSEPASSRGTEDEKPRDATTASSETNRKDGVPSKMPSRRVSIISISCPAQATLDSRLKRRRSSIDCPPKSKKLKLDRTVSHVSCAGDSNVEPKYQATEPASIRRARSLRSEASACSNEPPDSLFHLSPLTSPTSRSCADKDYPPTVPSTPLPNSADYARSKANPLARTLAVYRRRSLNIPAIPPVPIIAPPQHLIPTFVRCTEDQAIDRLKALLLRERSERERDGLIFCDQKRAERLKATCATDLAFSRRDSASTSDSSDIRGQWEEESTRSASESQESQDLVQSVNILSGQHRLVNREIWSNSFGITDDIRKEITGWILKKLPKEPVPREQSSGDQRRLGIDLYDQLTNSRQTRFHAAQLFHRYFLTPEKVEFWREACNHDRLEEESCDTDWKRGVWDLAVACMALGVKLHRDCLPPLGPVYAAEFLDMVPYSMTHNTFELAQRDIMYTFQFLLGSCTPQDVLDELWNALPTLRKATAPIRDGWAVVQSVTWDKLFEALLEPDMLQYPVTLLTAAALIDGLIFALARHYRTEADADVCKCKVSPTPLVSECVPDDIEPTSSQIHLFEATELVDDVILDARDVLQLSEMELDECRKWLSYVGQE